MTATGMTVTEIRGYLSSRWVL